MQNGTTDKQRGIENLIRRALKQNKLRNRSDVKINHRSKNTWVSWKHPSIERVYNFTVLEDGNYYPVFI